MAKNSGPDQVGSVPPKEEGRDDAAKKDAPPYDTKGKKWRVFFRLYDKTIFVDVGVPEKIVEESARDAVKASLELIRYVQLEEPEEEETPEKGS